MRNATMQSENGVGVEVRDLGDHFEMKATWPHSTVPGYSGSLFLKFSKEEVRNFLDVLLEEGEEEDVPDPKAGGGGSPKEGG